MENDGNLADKNQFDVASFMLFLPHVDENSVRQSEMELLQEFFFLVDSSHSEDTVNTHELTTSRGSDGSEGDISHLLEKDRVVVSRKRHIQLRTEISEHLWSMKGSDSASISMSLLPALGY